MSLSITRKLALWVAVLFTCGVARAADYVQSAIYNAGSVSTGSQAYPSNNTAGHTLIAFWGNGYNLTSIHTFTSISDSQGNVWQRIGSTGQYQDSGNSRWGGWEIMIAMNCKGGANTVTWVAGGTSLAVTMIIAEYQNISSYSLETLNYALNQSLQTVSSGNVLVNTGDDLIVVAGTAGNSPSIPSTPSGFTARATIGTPAEPSMGLYDNTAGSTGTTSASSTITSAAGGFIVGILVLRHSNPTTGRLQYAPFTTAATEVFPGPNKSGSVLFAMCRASGGSSSTVPTDTNGNTWIALPAKAESDANDGAQYSYAVNVASGTNTVSCSGANGMALWEYVGMNTVTPMAGSSNFFTNSASTTSWSTGSVTLPSSGILFSVAAVMNSVGFGFTPSAGFQGGMIYTSRNDSDSFQQWDEVVSSGTYSNSITTAAAGNYPQAVLVALSSTAISAPLLRQFNRGSGSTSDISVPSTLPSSVKAGNLMFLVVANQSGQNPGTTSDNQGNTYHLITGGGSNQYATYWARAGSSGTLTVTNTHANCIGISEYDNTTGFAIDVSNSGSNASATTIGTGSITTSAGGEIVISAGNIINTTSRLFFSSMNAGWNQLVFSCGGHNAAYFLGWQAPAAHGTYSNTFTFTGSASPVTAVIASFTLPSTSTTNPVVQIISDSRRFHPSTRLIAELSTRALAF